MPRPRRLNDPVKLNLLIDRTSKDIARKIASDRGISISRLFETLVAEENPIPQEISTESLQDSEAA
jgi:antitoxin component of RelBE/YafQ-DinJ toxin-antitoxin module